MALKAEKAVESRDMVSKEKTNHMTHDGALVLPYPLLWTLLRKDVTVVGRKVISLGIAPRERQIAPRGTLNQGVTPQARKAFGATGPLGPETRVTPRVRVSPDKLATLQVGEDLEVTNRLIHKVAENEEEKSTVKRRVILLLKE